MREILFRGKRIDNGELVEGGIVHQTDFYGDSVDRYFIIDCTDTDDNIGPAYRVHPDTVGQFTGLTDKNGKKIFEGDCFKTYCTGLPVYKHIVGYYPEHFAFMARCIEMNTVHYLSDYRPYAIEVIGNIHDNPELLEVSE